MKMKVINPDGSEHIVEDLSWQCVSNSKLPGKRRKKDSKIPDAQTRHNQQRASILKTIVHLLRTESGMTLAQICLSTGLNKGNMQIYLRDLEIAKKVRCEGRKYFCVED